VTPSLIGSAIAGVVPAAGASRRMGRTKALLQLNGKSFLERVVNTLRQGGCDPVYVVLSESDGEVADEARRLGASVLVNHDPGEGPITSLRIALEALDDAVDGIAYLPVDHALVGSDTVSSLLQAAATYAADLTLPVYGPKRGHPAIFRRTLFAELLEPTLEGGARTIVHRHLGSAHLMESMDRGVIADIDTPELYLQAQEAVGSEGVTP